MCHLHWVLLALTIVFLYLLLTLIWRTLSLICLLPAFVSTHGECSFRSIGHYCMHVSDAFYYLRGPGEVFVRFRPEKKTMTRRYHSLSFFLQIFEDTFMTISLGCMNMLGVCLVQL